jgi:hypothetical protein
LGEEFENKKAECRQNIKWDTKIGDILLDPKLGSKVLRI